ncbi:MAG TPA: alpha/beta hydrolase [Acidimicrobiales bacterium]|nr:alpha/beta hydrolase [Acidimicrobiales bacterium]
MARPHGVHVLDHHPHTDPALPVVILVHGSLDRASSFARVVRRLPDLHVVTYDRRGYNHSRAPGAAPVDLAGHVEDLLGLVGQGPAVAVGHSYGGDVALGAALAAPDAVTAVAAYEPPLSWLDWWPKRPRRPGEDDPARFAEGFFRRMVGDSSWERLTPTARAEREADGAALMAELTALRSGPPPFDVRALAVPAVFARGEASVWHHRRAVDELVAQVRGSELVEVAGAGHGAHLSHPGAFADMVRRTLARAVSVQEVADRRQ